jgi:hypothetical protein
VLEIAAAGNTVLVSAFAVRDDIFPLLLAVDVRNDACGMRCRRGSVTIVVDDDTLAVPAAAHGTLREEKLCKLGGLSGEISGTGRFFLLCG